MFQSFMSVAACLMLFFQAATAAERAELFRPDGGPGGFGEPVAVDGDTIVVGSGGRFGGPGAQDSVFVYSRDAGSGAWTGVQLTVVDGRAGDRFGAAVAIEDDWLAIGAPRAWANGLAEAGAVYLFQRNRKDEWSQVARLTASDPRQMARFGSDVAISDQRLLVGAPQVDMYSGMPIGAAYLFEHSADTSSWSQSKRFAPKDHLEGAFFGHSVAIAGNLLAIGRYGADRVYVYKYDDGWHKTDILEPRLLEGSSLSAGTGWELVMEGSTLAISAPEDRPPGTPEGWQSGVVHVYEYEADCWRKAATLYKPFDPVAAFGAALAMKDGYIAVTAFREGANGALYSRDGNGEWTEVLDLPKRDLNELLPIAVSGDHLVHPIWPLVDDRSCVVVYDTQSLLSGASTYSLAECALPGSSDHEEPEGVPPSAPPAGNDESPQSEPPTMAPTENEGRTPNMIAHRGGGGGVTGPWSVLVLLMGAFLGRVRLTTAPASR